MFHAPLPVLIKTRHACGHLVKEAVIGEPYKKHQVINHKKPRLISAPTLSGFLSCSLPVPFVLDYRSGRGKYRGFSMPSSSCNTESLQLASVIPNNYTGKESNRRLCWHRMRQNDTKLARHASPPTALTYIISCRC